MDSIWTKTAQLPRFNPVKEDMKTVVLIIGGGIAGLLCAYYLAQAGVDYILAEADTICSGITKNTTAKITAQHGLIYAALIQRFGQEKALLYLGANLRAAEEYRRLCREMDCDYREEDLVIYALHDRDRIERELDALRSLGADADFVGAPSLPFSAAGALRLGRQAQFHPLRFAASLCRGLRIFEHTKVLELAPGKAVTNEGVISFEKAIVATHFPMLNKHGGYFMRLYQHRSYVLALRNAPMMDAMYVDESEEGMSFRTYRDLLLLGGGGHRTGKKGGGWAELERFARAHYPDARIAARWATQDCMSLDGVPYIGQYSKNTPNIYVASGFNKWGMTSSMVAAQLLADLIMGKENPCAPVFSPARSSLRPQLLVNAAESALGLLMPTAPRCPHMGCALRYNPAEHSWDCPCHGSRFAQDGSLIDNPAADDKKM
ncbi:MAG: FAD-dependent oxidoreductase [Clostridiales bacterium]|nr:FAD-dependent oxidoreductase [Clostridiales bacterium]